MQPITFNNNQISNVISEPNVNRRTKIAWLVSIPFVILATMNWSQSDLQWFNKRNFAELTSGFLGGALFKYIFPRIPSQPVTLLTFNANLAHPFVDIPFVTGINAFNIGIITAEFFQKPRISPNEKVFVNEKVNSSQPPASIFSLLQKHLDEKIIGQTEAKNLLAKAIASHYEKLPKATESSILGKGNILLAGPSGTGKTLMIQTAAEALKIPFAIIDASRITPEGYRGPKFDEVFKQLYVRSNNNIQLAEKGIVFIDEIDKLFKNSDHNQGTFSGIQNQLLTILQGGDVKFKPSDSLFDPTITINTKNILFVMAGAFGSLFNETKTTSSISSQDLLNYGLSPEFVGRIGHLIQLRSMTKDDFRNVLTSEESAISFGAWKKEFQKYELILKIDPRLVEKIIDHAVTLKTGIRGLDFVLRQLMTSILIDSIEKLRNGELSPFSVINVGLDQWLEIGLVKQKRLDDHFPPLKEIKEILNQYVVGQQEAKDTITNAIYLHFCQQTDEQGNQFTLPKSNVLLIGPSGTGKTLIMDVLSKKLNIPMATLDAARVTREGIIGSKTSDAILSLLEQTKGNVKKAEHGIIFLDEIDKVFNDSKNIMSTEVGGKAIQNQLLSMLQGNDVTVTYNKEQKTVNTKNILFVMAGAFTPLTSKRNAQINDQNLLNAGMTPEFLGRIGYISQLHPLTPEELKETLTHGPDAMLNSWEKMFQIHGAQLTISPKTIATLVANAKVKATGTRGLQFELRKLLTPHLTKAIEHKLTRKDPLDALKIVI